MIVLQSGCLLHVASLNSKELVFFREIVFLGWLLSWHRVNQGQPYHSIYCSSKSTCKFFVYSKHAAHICTCQHILCFAIECANTAFRNLSNPLPRCAVPVHANVLHLIARFWKSTLSRPSCLATILFLHTLHVPGPTHSVSSFFLRCACKSLDRATVPFRIGRGFLPCKTSYAEMSQDT